MKVRIFSGAAAPLSALSRFYIGMFAPIGFINNGSTKKITQSFISLL